MAALRIVFMGTPDLACESLRALIESGKFDVVAAVCRPDQPKGRGLILQAPPVKQLALRKSIPVLQPARAREESFLVELRQRQPDLIVVAAYGQILPQTILDLPPHGCLNVHTSLLPRYRGAAPIQWAILNGDSETGVTIMKMAAGMDTGDIVARETTPILEADNARSLHDRLALLGAKVLVETVPEYVAGRIKLRPQPAEGISYAPKIKKQDGQIDWSQPARAIWNRVRALVPWPGAYTHWRSPERPMLLKLWEAQVVGQSGAAGRILAAGKEGILVGSGSEGLRILALQPEGGRRMSAAEFLAGHRVEVGQELH